MRINASVGPHEVPDHYAIACEQYVHWRQLGLSNHDMLAAVEHPSPPALPTSKYVVEWLSRAHRLISREDAA